MKIHNHPLTAGLTPKPIYNPVRPNITHGAVAWFGNNRLGTARQLLGKVRRLGYFCITGGMRSYLTAAKEVFWDLTPLHLIVRGSCKRSLSSSILVGYRWIKTKEEERQRYNKLLRNTIV